MAPAVDLVTDRQWELRIFPLATNFLLKNRVDVNRLFCFRPSFTYARIVYLSLSARPDLDVAHFLLVGHCLDEGQCCWARLRVYCASPCARCYVGRLSMIAPRCDMHATRSAPLCSDKALLHAHLSQRLSRESHRIGFANCVGVAHAVL